ncbi:MAG: undecaprenyl-phosphate glucose phosphotransferase [Cohaesibacter sp.]|nr:undecaprenyl-phosphate glucose phosphotransferase [Cohaesibacter sp.]
MQGLDPRAVYTSSAVLASSEDEPQGKNHQITEMAREVASEFASTTYAPMMVRGVIQMIDIALIALAGIAALHFASDSLFPNMLYPLGYSILGGLLFVLFMLSADSYNMSMMHSFSPQIGKIVGAWALVIILGIMINFFMDTGFEAYRGWLGAWFAAGIGSIVVMRGVQAIIVRRWKEEGRLERRAVIVGGGQPAADIISTLESQEANDIRICGIFDDRDDARSPALVSGYPKLGTVDDLVEFARLCKIDMLIVTIPVTAENRVLQMLHKLWVLPLDIHLSAHMNKMQFRRRTYSYVGKLPTVPIFAKPIANWGSMFKRIFDVIVSILAIILLSPILIATAIAVKLDSAGPVLFRQKRVGFNNEQVMVYKFRSLYHNQSDQKAAKSVTKNDSRVTKVGRFIRRTSIDELPQLFNVLTGTLSLVGPRPHVPHQATNNKLFEEVADGYMARHKVKPGITGWAQINGWRGEIDDDNKLKQRVEHDIYYIENWSLALDLYILASTPFKIINQDGAY